MTRCTLEQGYSVWACDNECGEIKPQLKDEINNDVICIYAEMSSVYNNESICKDRYYFLTEHISSDTGHTVNLQSLCVPLVIPDDGVAQYVMFSLVELPHD